MSVRFVLRLRSAAPAPRLALLASAALALGLAAPARAAVPTPEFPPTWFGEESVASTDGAVGFLVNPAAGGVRYPSELALSLGEVEPDRRLTRGVWSFGGFAVERAISRTGSGRISWASSRVTSG